MIEKDPEHRPMFISLAKKITKPFTIKMKLSQVLTVSWSPGEIFVCKYPLRKYSSFKNASWTKPSVKVNTEFLKNTNALIYGNQAQTSQDRSLRHHVFNPQPLLIQSWVQVKKQRWIASWRWKNFEKICPRDRNFSR